MRDRGVGELDSAANVTQILPKWRLLGEIVATGMLAWHGSSSWSVTQHTDVAIIIGTIGKYQ